MKTKMTVKRRRLIKSKKVHNVGYRPLLMEKAQELKILNFHAKNVKDKEEGIIFFYYLSPLFFIF
ncbi:MAG: hypothetical protein WA977_01505 [Halobacteriota archaeon]